MQSTSFTVMTTEDAQASELAKARSSYTAMLTVLTVFDCLFLLLWLSNILRGEVKGDIGAVISVLFTITALVLGWKGRFSAVMLMISLVLRIIQLVIYILLNVLVIAAILFLLIFVVLAAESVSSGYDGVGAALLNADFMQGLAPYLQANNVADGSEIAMGMFLIILVVFGVILLVSVVYYIIMTIVIVKGFKLHRLLSLQERQMSGMGGVELEDHAGKGMDEEEGEGEYASESFAKPYPPQSFPVQPEATQQPPPQYAPSFPAPVYPSE